MVPEGTYIQATVTGFFQLAEITRIETLVVPQHRCPTRRLSRVGQAFGGGAYIVTAKFLKELITVQLPASSGDFHSFLVLVAYILILGGLSFYLFNRRNIRGARPG